MEAFSDEKSKGFNAFQYPKRDELTFSWDPNVSNATEPNSVFGVNIFRKKIF